MINVCILKIDRVKTVLMYKQDITKQQRILNLYIFKRTLCHPEHFLYSHLPFISEAVKFFFPYDNMIKHLYIEGITTTFNLFCQLYIVITGQNIS